MLDQVLIEALKTVVRNDLESMEYKITKEELEFLVEQIHDSEDFLQHLNFTITDAAEFWAQEMSINLRGEKETT